MRIGLAYDLRKDYLEAGFTEEETAEFDSQETIDSLSETITRLGHSVEPIGNIFALARLLSSGHRWDLVFNICEGLYGRGREAQVPAILEAYDIPYTFSDPLTMSACLDKSTAKQLVRVEGVPTANFMVVYDLSELENYCMLHFPLFVKPLLEGTGKGINENSLVEKHSDLKTRCGELIEHFGQPVLVERYLPGREFTAGVIGTGQGARFVGALEVVLNEEAEAHAYSFKNKEYCEELVTYELVTEPRLLREIEEIAIASYRILECRDAGRVDLKGDHNGRLNFIEMNPLAGLHPTHSDLPILCTKCGIPYEKLISEIINSAASRKRRGANANIASMFRQGAG